MSDPAWLSSTIMQTVGALYGIFVAVFVLVTQSFPKYIELYKSDKETQQNIYDLIQYFKNLFTVLAYLVCFVELYNGMIVYFISDSIFDKFKVLLFFSYLYFILTIVFIVGFSYSIINCLISFETYKPLSLSSFSFPLDAEFFSFFNKFNFSKGITFIGINFCFITAVCATFVKTNHYFTIAILFIAYLIIVIFLFTIKLPQKEN